MNKNPVYEPDEDSFLLETTMLSELKSYIEGKDPSKVSVLDMGAGSGYLGFAAKKLGVNVTLVDNNPAAISAITLFAKSEDLDVSIIESNLFKNIPLQKFDCIVFNTPYLPNDDGVYDSSLYGGPKGNEIALEFLEEMQNYLTDKGFVLLLTSSLAHVEEVEKRCFSYNWTCKKVALKKLFFEELIVYKITK